MRLKYNLISTYRKELMGIAIILIMISHNTVDAPGAFHIINSGLQVFSQVGVDVFFFLSGFGCFYSMNKISDISTFYKRRLRRILPTYLAVVLLYGVIAVIFLKTPITECIWNYSLISFYVADDLHEWFVAAILLVYLLYPFIHHLIIKKEAVVKLAVLAIYILIFSSIFGHIHFRPVIMSIFVTRIPAFLIGALFAKRAIEEMDINEKVAFIVTTIGVLCGGIAMYVHHKRVHSSWTIIRTSYIFVLLAIVFIWIVIQEYNRRENVITRLVPSFLSYIGGLTLEIYLFHEKILGVLSHIIISKSFPALLVENILAIIFSILLSDILKRCIERCMSYVAL